MKAPHQFRRFVVFSNLFISFCAALLTAETIFLFGFSCNYHSYDILVFFGTLFVYTLHYFLKKELTVPDERQTWRKSNKWLFKYILAFSLAGTIVASAMLLEIISSIRFTAKIFFLFVLLLIGLLSVFYSHPTKLLRDQSLRKFGKFKLLYLSLIWTVTTGLVPLLLMHGENGLKINFLHVSIFLFHRLIFIGSIAFLFNIYDYHEDKESNTNTFAVSWGQKRSLVVGKWFFLFLNLAASVVFIISFGATTVFFLIAVFIPVVVVYWLYGKFDPAEPESSFVLRYDGLMIIKALLLIFATVISKN